MKDLLKSDVQLVGDGAGTVLDGVIEVEGQLNLQPET